MTDSEKYVQVRIYEPSYSIGSFSRVNLSKWDLMKIILCGQVDGGYMWLRGKTYSINQLDEGSSVNIATVKAEE
jgi:hypothetical protein